MGRRPTPAFAGARDSSPTAGTPAPVGSPPGADLPPASAAAAEPAPGGGRAPRKRTTRKAADSTPKRGRPSNLSKIERQLDDTLVGLGTIVSAFDEFDGLTIVAGAPKVSSALVSVADQNPRVRAALERFCEVSGWGGVFAAVVPIIVPILANHGALPAQLRALSPAAEGGGDGALAVLLGGDLGGMFDGASEEDLAALGDVAARLMANAASNGHAADAAGG